MSFRNAWRPATWRWKISTVWRLWAVVAGFRPSKPSLNRYKANTNGWMSDPHFGPWTCGSTSLAQSGKSQNFWSQNKSFYILKPYDFLVLDLQLLQIFVKPNKSLYRSFLPLFLDPYFWSLSDPGDIFSRVWSGQWWGSGNFTPGSYTA